MTTSDILLRVSLFGHFAVECRGHSVAGLEGHRLQEIFSYLLLNRRRRCSREVLANLFWGESSTEQSKRNLRQMLWQLQAALEPEKAPDSGCFIHCTADWLQINLNADLWLDVDVFERAWEETRHIAGKDLSLEEAQMLLNAVALHQEILLPDNYEDWCLRERDRLLSLCIAMLEKLMEYSEARHDYDAALSFGSRILDYDRVRETTYQQLMRLYYVMGKRVEALKQYQRCETVLLEELGALPSKSTLTLYQQILLEQLEDHSRTAPRLVEANDQALILSHILDELQLVQSIQSQVQQQLGLHIEKIERALHTFLSPTGISIYQPLSTEKENSANQRKIVTIDAFQDNKVTSRQTSYSYD